MILTSTATRSTQARNFLIFFGKMIIISYFIARMNIQLCVNDNLFLSVDRDDFCGTVRCTRMIDEAPGYKPVGEFNAKTTSDKNSPKITFLGSIDDEIVIYSEEITGTDSLTLIYPFSTISNCYPNNLSKILKRL
jgi:hypothetical protein